MILENLKKSPSPYYLIAVFALLQFVIAVFTHSLSFTHEEAMWQYIGRNWISNDLPPYSGGVDNKSPLIFYIFGISDWLFGNNIWFPRLLGTIVQSIGVLYLYKIVLRLADYNAAFFSITIYSFSLMWLTTGGRYVSFTETYAVAFMI
ncbi:MAG TPA: glycosyltransferase family 39 protein, partial [Ferruginibacter sp.]|nr:glycosyltransferase family 39 protein [Ferruginibacter sp.]